MDLFQIISNDFFVLVLSFVLLVFASWCVGEGGEILGQKYDASIIGGLIIAWLNTAPETIFFIAALESKNPQFAVGAMSGSTIVVCTVALGACLWIGSHARHSGAFQLQSPVKKQCFILMISSLIPLSATVIGFNLLLGLVGIAFYFSFIIYSLMSNQGISDKIDDLESGPKEEEEISVKKGIGFLTLGGMLIFSFSTPFIRSVVSIAGKLDVNPILLAFFLAPIASEMPEILESVSLSRKGNSQNINIAFSNLVGGTITKTTLLTGVLCFYGVWREFAWVTPNYNISLSLLAVCAFIASFIGHVFHKQTRWHGMILFILFIICGLIQYHFNSNSGILGSGHVIGST